MIDALFDNTLIRRQDRTLGLDTAKKILDNGEFAYISFVTPECLPYGVPVNYVWDGDYHIYVHCAFEGKKIDCIRHCGDISMCIVGFTHIVPEKFSSKRESIIVSGIAEISLSEEDRMAALKLLTDKYCGKIPMQSAKYIAAMASRTNIIRISIKSISAKGKL